MRKMQDFVVKGKEVFVGLEDSKKSWKLCVRCGRVISHEVTMPAEYGALRAYLKRHYPECDLTVIYEAGFHGFWLHDLLVADGVKCVVTPANKVTDEKDNRVKTDKRDARRLAKNLENQDYKVCWVPDRELREDRQISRTQTQVLDDIVAYKNRIRQMFHFHGLKMPAGKWSQEHYRQLSALKLSPSLRVSLDAYLRILLHLEKESKELRAQMKVVTSKERYRESVALKDSCPGVGELTAMRLTLELGDLSRFPDGKELGSYLGLTASEFSTGARVRRGGITRQGRGRLRGWLIQCAWASLRKDAVLLGKFNRVFSNCGCKQVAIVAVARKLVGRMRAIELKREPYQSGVIR
jgi:transposase